MASLPASAPLFLLLCFDPFVFDTGVVLGQSWLWAVASGKLVMLCFPKASQESCQVLPQICSNS